MLIPMRTCKRNLAAIVIAVFGLRPMLMTAQHADECRDKRGQAAWVNSPVYNDAN